MTHAASEGRPPVALALTLAVVAISLAAVFFRLAAPTHPLLIAGGRLLIAAVLLAPLTLRAWRGGRLPAPVLRAGLAGGVCYAIHFGSFVASLSYTTVAASVTIVTATPLLLATWGLVRRKDPPTRALWLAIGLALTGVMLIGGADLGSSSQALWGDLLALAGASSIAAYFLIVRDLGGDLDAVAFGGLCCAVGAPLLLGTSLVAGVPFEVGEMSDLLWIGAAALIPQLLGHTLITWSLRHTTPTVVGLATVGEPVGSTLLAWLVLGELPTHTVALGCVVVLVAVTVALRRP